MRIGKAWAYPPGIPETGIGTFEAAMGATAIAAVIFSALLGYRAVAIRAEGTAGTASPARELSAAADSRSGLIRGNIILDNGPVKGARQ